MNPHGTNARCDGRKLRMGVDGRPALWPTGFHPNGWVGGMWVPCLCRKCWVTVYEGDDPPAPRPFR